VETGAVLPGKLGVTVKLGARVTASWAAMTGSRGGDESQDADCADNVLALGVGSPAVPHGRWA
jgi:hypothetical protein